MTFASSISGSKQLLLLLVADMHTAINEIHKPSSCPCFLLQVIIKHKQPSRTAVLVPYYGQLQYNVHESKLNHKNHLISVADLFQG